MPVNLASRGIRPSDRIALIMENSPELFGLYLACLQLGAVAMPIGQSLSEQEIDKILRGARPKLVIHTEELSENFSSSFELWHVDLIGGDRELLEIDCDMTTQLEPSLTKHQ